MYVFKEQVNEMLIGGKVVGDMACEATKVLGMLAEIPKEGITLLVSCIVVVIEGWYR